MKHLLTYNGFCKFTKEWEVIEYANDVIKLRRGDGLVESTQMKKTNDEYHGTVSCIKSSCFNLYYNVNDALITLAECGEAGDSFVYSLPTKYFHHIQYHITFDDKIKQCIILSDQEYYDLKQVRIAT
jgi:hypothetical protein